MELKKQVCSLELAKRLKELGVKQESFWYYWELNGTPHNNFRKYTILQHRKSEDEDIPHISAFTVAELGEMLPYTLEDRYDLEISKMQGGDWLIGYRNNSQFMELNEANARAKMLIYLLENNLITN